MKKIALVLAALLPLLAACKRTATRALILDKTTGKHFYFVDTHLDHVSKEARQTAVLTY